MSTDPNDTILAAEVAAADALIASLDKSRIRVGIVTFSGDMDPETGLRLRYDQQDAWLETALTDDFARARTSLGAIMARGPHGGTNFAAGLRLAVTELAGLTGAKSQPRPGAKKVVLFLTDGIPTFPIGPGGVADEGDIEAALNAARLAHKAGIVVNSYALGPNALTNPIAATELARITLGTYMPVRNPGDIISFLQGVTFANIEDVVFTNLTTREVSTDVQLAPDGTFSGFVPVQEGRNKVRITALASDGRSGSVELDLDFEKSGLTERELALELDRIRERNKQLLLLVERERIQRFREQQRKVLELEPAGESEVSAGRPGSERHQGGIADLAADELAALEDRGHVDLAVAVHVFFALDELGLARLARRRSRTGRASRVPWCRARRARRSPRCRRPGRWSRCPSARRGRGPLRCGRACASRRRRSRSGLPSLFASCRSSVRLSPTKV